MRFRLGRLCVDTSGRRWLSFRPSRLRLDQESRSAEVFVSPSLPSYGRHHAELRASKGSPTMPTKNSNTESQGFSAAERAAMKNRAEELRAEIARHDKRS